jgi:hypothetical protein
LNKRITPDQQALSMHDGAALLQTLATLAQGS